MHYSTETLTDYIHGELAPGEDASLFAHLAACGDCRASYDALTEALRSSPRAKERELPPMLKAQIWAAVRTERPSALDTVRSFLRPAYALPALAAILVVGYFGVPAARNGLTRADQPGVSATYYLDEHAAESQANPLADRPLRVNNADERTSTTPLVINSATYSVASAHN
jgi:predicted anti-sigma-YlaC factor YlaD